MSSYEQQEETTKLPGIGGLVSRLVECSSNKTCKCHGINGKKHGPYWYVGFYKHKDERYWYYIGKVIEGAVFEDWPVEYQERYERAVEEYKRERGLSSYTTKPKYNKNQSDTQRIQELEAALHVERNKVAILEDQAFMNQNFIEANDHDVSVRGKLEASPEEPELTPSNNGDEYSILNKDHPTGLSIQGRTAIEQSYQHLGFKKSEILFEVASEEYLIENDKWSQLEKGKLKRKISDARKYRDPVYDYIDKLHSQG